MLVIAEESLRISESAWFCLRAVLEQLTLYLISFFFLFNLLFFMLRYHLFPLFCFWVLKCFLAVSRGETDLIIWSVITADGFCLVKYVRQNLFQKKYLRQYNFCRLISNRRCWIFESCVSHQNVHFIYVYVFILRHPRMLQRPLETPNVLLCRGPF